MVNPMPSMPAEQYMRSIDPPAGEAGSGAPSTGVTPPLWLKSPTTSTLTITYGQVSGITPSGGWAGGGNDVGVDVNISGYGDNTYNIYFGASVGATTGAVTAVAVTATSGSVPASTSSAAYLLCGVATISSGEVVTVSPSIAWSQDFVACTAGDPTTYHFMVA